MPLISVYIPCHNYGKYVSSAIESVLRQSFRDWELIIIDDGSTDNSSEVINLYAGDNRISIYRTEAIGLPKVCNFALQKARGEYIIRLDGDDIFDENILLVLSVYLGQHPDIAMVFPDYYLIDDFGEIFALDKRHTVYELNNVVDIPPHGACTMIRKSILDEYGGYREDLGAQDGFDLWSRIKDKHKIANINLPLFYYRRHGSNLTSNTNKILIARRRIKKDAVTSKLNSARPIVAVIPCRENYDFIKDLWKFKINGRTLLERDIETCLQSTNIDRVIVACDNPDAESVLKSFSDPRLSFAIRDSRETIRSASIVPTLDRLVRIFDPELLGITVVRYIQTPFVSSETLDEAITSLLMHDVDSSCGVEAITAPVFRKTSKGLEPLQKKGILNTDFDQIFKDANTFTALRSKNLKTGSLTGSTSVYFEVTPKEAFFIDSQQSLKIASILFE